MKSRLPLVALLFSISGATGLLYEVAFSKALATVFGATAYAVSTVLASFMGGLALGAWAAGRFGRRIVRPLMVYGILEIAIGLAAAATPSAFSALTDAYVTLARSAPESLAALTAMRAILTAAIIVVPTLAMGATLPLMAKSFVGRPDMLPRLYAINTAGGALGALGAAYVVLPTLGIRNTMFAAAAADLLIGGVAIAAGRKLLPAVTAGPSALKHAPQRADGVQRIKSVPWSSLSIAVASGFLVFAVEVVGTHLLALLIGNSAYAFGLMLAAFLVCLSIGAARAPKLLAKHGPLALPLSLTMAGLCVAVTLPLWDQLPRVFAFAGKYVTSFYGRELVRALAALGILALPTVWMGATFPLLLRQHAADARVEQQVGRLTTVNTLGTIAGAIVTGYWILPYLGSQRSLEFAAVLFVLVGAFAMLRRRGRHLVSRLPAAVGGLALLVILLMPRWDLARLTNGANVYFTHGPPPDQIVFVREDVHGGVTTVATREGVTTMYTNGKFQGDDGREMVAQRRFAHFPSLFVSEPRRALVIGLGTGTTLGTVTGYPFHQIDVAEISPAIVEAADTYYRDANRGALHDPRVNLIFNDGRNVALVAVEPYDLITIELTSVWFAGAANLYSQEFYALAKSRLTDHGVLQQWVQLHHLRPRELASIILTIRSEFDHVALFEGGAQGILVASRAPLVASKDRLQRMQSLSGVQATLDGRTLESLFSEMLCSGPELDELVATIQKTDGATLSTDDNLYLEYATPKGNVLNYDDSLSDMLARLQTCRPDDVRARHLRQETESP